MKITNRYNGNINNSYITLLGCINSDAQNILQDFDMPARVLIFVPNYGL